MATTYFGLTLTQALGLNVFLFSLMSAGFLYWLDRSKRINLEIPYGDSIPYSLAVAGGGILYLSSQGPFGLAEALALALFIGFVTQKVVPLLKQT